MPGFRVMQPAVRDRAKTWLHRCWIPACAGMTSKKRVPPSQPNTMLAMAPLVSVRGRIDTSQP
jgi:hypothetical protein